MQLMEFAQAVDLEELSNSDITLGTKKDEPM
jgi:hypothetical protein